MTTSAAVLIVDDDPDFRALARIYIEAAGVEALEAPDCPHAVALLREARDRVRLVLLDYWMPNMEPTRCCRCIRALVRPETRIVLVTAAVDASKRAQELGLRDFLQKPLELEKLRAMVQGTKRALG